MGLYKDQASNQDSYPLRICIIGSATSVHVQTRAKAFADRGHQICLITPRAAGSGLTERTPRYPTARFPLFSKLGTLFTLYDYYRLIRECPADIVHIHYAYGWGPWLALFANRHPLVVSIMGGDVLFEERRSILRGGGWLTKQLIHEADLVTSKSDHLSSVLRQWGVLEDKIMKVIWGVDLNHFRRINGEAFRRELGLTPEDQVILSPRILQRFYNIHMIIEALPSILQSHPRAKLLITEHKADPIYKKELSDLAKTLGVDNGLMFVGNIKHEMMPAYYNLADVVVSIPPSDGFPQTVLEAMACGIPNIVPNLSLYKELLTHLVSAFFVDLSAENIAGGIKTLLGDSGLRQQIAQEGLRIVRDKANFHQEVKRVEMKLHQLHGAPITRKRRLIHQLRLLYNMLLAAVKQ